ncbi:PP2C family protein-serine/threonine phosphatase [Halioxenophilus sp. WMMB6]|uniref:PP2C family protein-serine/threonine phosphatase n=1 Tax=Halioxenophilus sp. WMMB6 TaxID=3073815 RepID=UPI00295EC65E|nr:SpoIIE family protein phosphatase [Halioxenophilus sp. WMMB6]
MKVLVVDALAAKRQKLTELLSALSLEVAAASTHWEAVNAVAQSGDWSMIFISLDAPELDGLETTRQLKKQLGRSHIPVILLSSRLDRALVESSFAAGGDDHLPWPIDETLLFSRITAHQRSARLHRQQERENSDLLRYQNAIAREHLVLEHVFDHVIKPARLECESLNVLLAPLSTFNGDLYLAYRTDGGATYLFLGDFTGHGLSAAIGCMPVADLFYAMAAKSAPVGDIAAEANRKLLKILPHHMFCCAAIVKLSPGMTSAELWLGGMNDLYIINPAGGEVATLQSLHMPLGVLDNHEFSRQEQQLSLLPGSRLLAYTDGVIEAQNSAGELFGEQRLAEVIGRAGDNLVATVVAALNGFRGATEQKDDITLLEIITAKAPPARATGTLVEELSREYLPTVIDPTLTIQAGAEPWQVQIKFLPTRMQKIPGMLDLLQRLSLNVDAQNNIAVLLSQVMTELLQTPLLVIHLQPGQPVVLSLRELDREVSVHIEMQERPLFRLSLRLMLPESEPGSEALHFLAQEAMPQQLVERFDKLELHAERSVLLLEISA